MRYATYGVLAMMLMLVAPALAAFPDHPGDGREFLEVYDVVAPTVEQWDGGDWTTLDLYGSWGANDNVFAPEWSGTSDLYLRVSGAILRFAGTDNGGVFYGGDSYLYAQPNGDGTWYVAAGNFTDYGGNDEWADYMQTPSASVPSPGGAGGGAFLCLCGLCFRRRRVASQVHDHRAHRMEHVAVDPACVDVAALDDDERDAA